MRPEFYRHVDPVFSYVIRLQQRLESGTQADSLDPDQVYNDTLAVINVAEGKLGQTREWLLAKYALVAWIDELMTTPGWNGADWWTDNCLEVRCFDPPRQAYSGFFEKAKEAAELVNKDPIEVYYVCVLLGFRGLYQDNPSSSELARQYKFPADLKQWIKNTAKHIQLGYHNVSLEAAKPAPDRILVLDGKRRLLKWVLALFVVGVIALIVGRTVLEESRTPSTESSVGPRNAAVVS